MNGKNCARCEKTVYPIEELKCLDKVWHKTCFKCYQCGMILNMKTYKGFNKLPYCNAHYPQARATTVAETPESRRLAENTKIQSNIKYHADFEKQKGKLTQVADDPETLRIRNTSKIISNATYHGEYEKKKQMEERRTMLTGNETTYNNNNIRTAGLVDAMYQQQPPMAAPVAGQRPPMTTAGHNNNLNLTNNNNIRPVQTTQPKKQQIMTNMKTPRPVAVYSTQPIPAGGYANTNNNGMKQQQTVPGYNVAAMGNYPMAGGNQPYPVSMAPGSGYPPGKYHQQPQQSVPTDIHMYHHGSNVDVGVRMPPAQEYRHTAMGLCFRAIYDYTAQDLDEVSFLDGDLIINCRPIDDGWMTGTVQRTGHTGMLPSNYVESA